MFGFPPPPPRRPARDVLAHRERMQELYNQRDDAALRRDSEHKARIAEAHAYGRRKAELEVELQKERDVVSDREAALARQIAEVHDTVGLDIGTPWKDVLAAIRPAKPAATRDYCGRGVCSQLDGHEGSCRA